MRSLLSVLLAVFCLMFSSVALAQTPSCDALTGKSAENAQTVLKTPISYGCCNDSIEACLNKPSCKIGPVLANEVCRLANLGKTTTEMIKLLGQRAETMHSKAEPVKIELLPHHIMGNPDAKVVLSIYMCARCVFCSRYVPLVVEYIKDSPLKDKIAVNLRPFPIKTHPGSTPAAIAVEAAAQMGKGWEYLIYAYKNFDAYTEQQLPVWANDLGLDVNQFNALLALPETRKFVSKSKKEGLTNGVENTPTFFINGFMYSGKFDPKTLMSMLEEAVVLSEDVTPTNEQHE